MTRSTGLRAPSGAFERPGVGYRPLVMDALRAADIARLLGVTRQRAAQFAATDPTFPQPAETEPHRRWDRAEVEAWAERCWWDTRPWRQPAAHQPKDR